MQSWTRCGLALLGLASWIGAPADALTINATFVDAMGETWDATRQGVVTQAIADWESVITDVETVDIVFDFTAAGTGGYLGQWQGGYGGFPGDDMLPWSSGMSHTVHFNADRFSGANYLWWDASPTDGSDQPFVAWDALSVARHELGHAMGFAAGFYQRWFTDPATDKWAAENIVAGVFDPGGLAIAMAAGDNGHVADAGATAGDLMVQALINNTRRDISATDVAMLEQAYGYTVLAPVPEPSTGFLVGLGLLLMGLRGRHNPHAA